MIMACALAFTFMADIAVGSEPNDVPDLKMSRPYLLSPDEKYLAFQIGVWAPENHIIYARQPVVIDLLTNQKTVLPLKISPLGLHWCPDRSGNRLFMLQQDVPADPRNYPSEPLQAYSIEQKNWLKQFTKRFPAEWIIYRTTWNANGKVLAMGVMVLSPAADVLNGKQPADYEERLIFVFAPDLEPVVTDQQARRIFWADSTRLFFQSNNRLKVAELRPDRKFKFSEYPVAHSVPLGDAYSGPKLSLRAVLSGKPLYSVDDKLYYGQTEFATLPEGTNLFTDGSHCAVIDDGTRLAIYNDRMNLVHELKSTQVNDLRLVAVSLSRKTCFFEDHDRRVLYRQHFDDPQPQPWISIDDIISVEK
jgi:hypothetical protein